MSRSAVRSDAMQYDAVTLFEMSDIELNSSVMIEVIRSINRSLDIASHCEFESLEPH